MRLLVGLLRRGRVLGAWILLAWVDGQPSAVLYDAKGRVVKGNKRHPNIEDEVTIYAGATILGDVTIGRGSIIGGNVWLLDSVPARTVVYQEGGKTLMRTAAADHERMIGEAHEAGS